MSSYDIKLADIETFYWTIIQAFLMENIIFLYGPKQVIFESIKTCPSTFQLPLVHKEQLPCKIRTHSFNFVSLALVITQTPWVQRHNALPWRRSWCRGKADSHASPCCPGSCTPSSARASRLIFHWVDVFRTLQIVQIYWCFQCYICEFQDF